MSFETLSKRREWLREVGLILASGCVPIVSGPAAGQIPPAGVLRIAKDASVFDPDYFVDLNAVTRSPTIVGTFLINDTTLAAQLWSDCPASPGT